MLRWLVVPAAVALSAFALASAQPYQPPRTPDGHPDLQGIWGTGFLWSLERPDGVALDLPPDEARVLAAKYLSYTPEVVDPDANTITGFTLPQVRGVYRSGLVIEPPEGKVPFAKSSLESIGRFAERSEYAFDNPEERPNVERCLIGWGQAPLRPEHGFTPTQIVQTPDTIVLMTEDVGGLRIIHMTGDPPPDALRTFEGYSRGHWEGDTLVIETTHHRLDDPYREQIGPTLIVGPNSKVIERLTRVSDTELVEQFTVDDPSLYTRPWLAEFSHTLSTKKAYEYACHEANYALTNMLRAGRLGRQPKPPTPKPAPKPAKAKSKPR